MERLVTEVLILPAGEKSEDFRPKMAYRIGSDNVLILDSIVANKTTLIGFLCFMVRF